MAKIRTKLVNNLKQLQKESTDFTNINQVPATDITISGMTASQCGIPLFAPSHPNTSGKQNTFLSGAKCLGDILSKLDYHLIYVQGAYTHFSGKDKFYKTHKFNEIYGRKELTKHLTDKSYLNGWGLYDDSTLDIAFEKFDQLSQKSENFALFTLTLDTHHPKGHPSKSCKDIPYEDGGNNILNAVHCSDYLIAKFIKKIQNSEHSNKTLIVLTSDHLALNNTASDILAKGNRKDLFLIIDPKNKQYRAIDTKGSMLDVAPTILSKLGVEVDLGLGRNLFKKDSLFSTFDNFDKKLLSWRANVIALWNFPKIGLFYTVNSTKKEVSISNSYPFPVLFKINEDREVQPMFEIPKILLLRAYLKDFKGSQRFIWIDQCSKLNYIFKGKYSEGQFCIAQGTLAGEIEIIDIQKETSNIKTDQLFAKFNTDIKSHSQIRKRIDSYTEQYQTSIEKGIAFNRDGYPSFIKKVFGISGKESWGRWSDANLAQAAKFVFTEKLPTNFTLELNIGAYGSNIGRKTQIRIGNQQKILLIKSFKTEKYELTFNNVHTDTIEITPPIPSTPNNDSRKLGIKFESLRILTRKKKTMGSYMDTQNRVRK